MVDPKMCECLALQSRIRCEKALADRRGLSKPEVCVDLMLGASYVM